jgi:L-lactate permease
MPQTAAAASGSMICLANIIVAKSVVSSELPEGAFIRVTAPICALHCAVLTLVAVSLFMF